MSDVQSEAPPVRGATEAYGASPAAAVVSRGNNIVFAAPPSPGYALPVLEAALARPVDTRQLPVLVIAPDSVVDVWAQAASTAAAALGKTAAIGAFPSRLVHHLQSGRIDCLTTTVAVASESIRRSGLATGALSAVVVVWPETELSDESFVALFADLPKETQRIVITADPAASAEFAERYAWRAPVLGPLAGQDDPDAPVRVRGVHVAWDGRLAALGSIADLLDVDHLRVWTAAATDHSTIGARLAAHGVTSTVLAGAIPGQEPTVFFDAPPPELLAQAGPAAVLLVCPGTELYTRRIARVEPVNLPGILDEADRAIAADRRAVRARIEAGLDRGAYATVAPLFERYGAAEVAVALQALWAEARSRAPASVAAAAVRSAPRLPQKTRLWVNLGRKDNVSLGEVLGFLHLDLSIKEGLGRVDMKETFTLIEFAGDDAARRALEKLQGATFKGRRLSARIDRGREGARRAP